MITSSQNNKRNHTMFNIGITGTFNGVFPSTVPVGSRSHSAAVRHYKSALRARQLNSSGSRIVLESSYGFQFRVDSRTSFSSSSSRTSVRLALPSRPIREAVARALGGSHEHRPRVHRTGIIVTDPFGIT